jgi:putative transposase
LRSRDCAQAIKELRLEHELSILLKVAKMARSTYYYHIKELSKDDKDDYIFSRIKHVFDSSKGTYGYRRITMALKNEGMIINHKKVFRLMKLYGIKCEVRVKRYRSYKGNVGKIAPNVLQRDFRADMPNKKWVTDLTEFSLFGEKLYLSPVLDLFNGEIISYNLSKAPNLRLVISMLNNAIANKNNLDGLILHSDQGWHYQHYAYRNILKQNGIIQSMSRKGNCLDNAVVENFFGLLKSELLYLQKFSTMEDFRNKLVDYIKFYNERRIKLKLKGMSPVAYRTHALSNY